MTFKAILSADRFQKQNDGTYKDLSTTEAGLQYLSNSDKAIDIKIVGIIRALESAGEIVITRDTAEDEYIE